MVGLDEGFFVLEVFFLDLSRAFCIFKYFFFVILGRRLGLYSRWKWFLIYLGRYFSYNFFLFFCYFLGGGLFLFENLFL